MAMILPPKVTALSHLGQAFGGGVGQGLNEGMKLAQDQTASKKKGAVLEKTFGLPEGSLQNIPANEQIKAAGILSKVMTMPGDLYAAGVIGPDEALEMQNQLGRPPEEIMARQKEKETSDVSSSEKPKMSEEQIAKQLRYSKGGQIEGAKIKAQREATAEKATRGFRDTIRSGAEEARKGMSAVNDIMRIAEKGFGGPLTLDNLFIKMGIPGLASPEGQLMQARLVDLFGGYKNDFGVRLSDADLAVILNKMPDIGRTPEGNKLLAKVLKNNFEYQLMKDQARKNVTKKHGFTLNFEEQFDDELEKLSKDKSEEFRNDMENLGRLAGIKIQDSTSDNAQSQPTAQRVQIYDPSGKHMGSIDSSQADQLAPGWTVK